MLDFAKAHNIIILYGFFQPFSLLTIKCYRTLSKRYFIVLCISFTLKIGWKKLLSHLNSFFGKIEIKKDRNARKKYSSRGL